MHCTVDAAVQPHQTHVCSLLIGASRDYGVPPFECVKSRGNDGAGSPERAFPCFKKIDI